MAREYELIEEARQTEAPQFELTQSTHADVLVDIVVEFLRQAFARHPIYTYVPREDSFGPDFGLTQIVIVDKYTEDALFLPTVTMAIDSVQTQWIQFSQSPFLTVLKMQMNPDGSIKRDDKGDAIPSHYEYVGAYNSSITLQVNAGSTLEREELVNLLHIILAESGRDTLYMRGVFVKSVNVGGQSEVEYRNDYIFQQTVTIDAYSEWRRIIPVGETLEAIGMTMNVLGEAPTSPPVTVAEVVPIAVFNLSSSPFVVDPLSGQPVAVGFELSAVDDAAPVALSYNGTAWVPSEFWKKSLVETLIPFENFMMEINISDRASTYIQHAGKAIIQAITARALSLTQGRQLPDGTKVLGETFVYSNGRVDLRGFDKQVPLIYHITVEPDNSTVEMRLSENKLTLVAKNIVLDAYGAVISGDLYKRRTSSDVIVSTSGTLLLDSADYDTMSATDLLMIIIYGDQPFRYSLGFILDRIDELLEELADTSIVIANRLAKIANITLIKQQLIQRSETYLLRRPAGL